MNRMKRAKIFRTGTINNNSILEIKKLLNMEKLVF